MDYAAHRRHYRENHKTLGCKITHMFGVPMILSSLVVLFFSWQWAFGLFSVGWVLQFAGHYVFEKNNPVFFGKPGFYTYFYALYFVLEEWWLLLTGRFFSEREKD